MSSTREWRRLDLPAIETFREDGSTFEGRVTVRETAPWTVEYRVTFDPTWVTREALVSVRRAGSDSLLELRREPSGRWLAGSVPIPACDGCLDVDLGVTPSTNTSAIRRLGLEVGHSAELNAAWVRFPDLSIEPLRQRYTRLEPLSYLYESLRDGKVVFRARLEVDATGLVERYEGVFERVHRGPPGLGSAAP